MEIEQRISHLSHEINKVISEFATLELRKIKNVYITETGEIANLIDPGEINRQIDECREVMNENLFELDQLIGERDNLERQ